MMIHSDALIGCSNHGVCQRLLVHCCARGMRFWGGGVHGTMLASLVCVAARGAAACAEKRPSSPGDHGAAAPYLCKQARPWRIALATVGVYQETCRWIAARMNRCGLAQRCESEATRMEMRAKKWVCRAWRCRAGRREAPGCKCEAARRTLCSRFEVWVVAQHTESARVAIWLAASAMLGFCGPHAGAWSAAACRGRVAGVAGFAVICAFCAPGPIRAGAMLAAPLRPSSR
jgi:hypothetical protein